MKKVEPIRFDRGRPMLLAGLRRYHLYAQSEQSIPEQWQQFRSPGQIAGQLGSIFYGVMCGHDSSGFEYMSGVEVESFAGLSADLGRMRIMEQDYAVFEHSGHISAIRTTWERILHEWLPGGGYQSAHKPDFERYDEQFDSRTGLGRVEIWISIARQTPDNKEQESHQ
jgi:predicted transcriptional regulator YdeE